MKRKHFLNRFMQWMMGNHSSMNDFYLWELVNTTIISIKNTFECHVSTAKFRRPTKRQNRGPLSCVTVGYIQSKQNQTHNRLRVLLDSGCTATLINKKFVGTFPTTKTNKVKWRTKTGVLRQPESVTSLSPFLHSMRIDKF